MSSWKICFEIWVIPGLTYPTFNNWLQDCFVILDFYLRILTVSFLTLTKCFENVAQALIRWRRGLFPSLVHLNNISTIRQKCRFEDSAPLPWITAWASQVSAPVELFSNWTVDASAKDSNIDTIALELNVFAACSNRRSTDVDRAYIARHASLGFNTRDVSGVLSWCCRTMSEALPSDDISALTKSETEDASEIGEGTSTILLDKWESGVSDRNCVFCRLAMYEQHLGKNKK